MTQPAFPSLTASDIELTLDRSPAIYAPGDRLEARARLPSSAARVVRTAELSVVWYTAGKGDEDMHVHEFQRWQVADGGPLENEIATTLPMSPLSYAGVIIKVCWCVRVRLFLDGGKQLLVEQPLQLGEIASPEGAVVAGEEVAP